MSDNQVAALITIALGLVIMRWGHLWYEFMSWWDDAKRRRVKMFVGSGFVAAGVYFFLS